VIPSPFAPNHITLTYPVSAVKTISPPLPSNICWLFAALILAGEYIVRVFVEAVLIIPPFRNFNVIFSGIVTSAPNNHDPDGINKVPSEPLK
jgi:hypothetical protein